jgi:hypothetical protein
VEYETKLTAARAPVAVMELFAQSRESRARVGDPPLEVAFAATGVDGGEPLPAAVWVALRQGEVEASVDALLRTSRTAFVVGEHEELDANYRLTTIEERRTLPDVDLLETQLATFLQIPRDVIAMIAEWGPDDPRTAKEIEALLDGRFGAPVAPVAPVVPAVLAGPSVAAPPTQPHRLEMSADELTAMLQLTPEQGRLLRTLVRQADVTITSTSAQVLGE